MRLEFRAREAGFEAEGGDMLCLIAGAAGPDVTGVEHYMTFQRGFEDEDPDDDWGVHFEFDDQSNGNYRCIRRCRFTRTVWEVELLKPIDPGQKWTSVSVDLTNLEDPTWGLIRDGLPRIFRGTEGVLELE